MAKRKEENTIELIEEATNEEIGAMVDIFIKLPREDRLLLSNSAFTLFLRAQMNKKEGNAAV